MGSHQRSLEIVPVTRGNRETAEALAVAPGQEHLVEPVRECLAEADRLPLWRPLLLLDGEVAVGFAMVGRFRLGEKVQVWFDRLLIDRRHQGRGYGRAAVENVLALLRRDYPGDEIRLSVYADNEVAIGLYESFGFAFNGELDTKGERVMVLRERPARQRPPRTGGPSSRYLDNQTALSKWRVRGNMSKTRDERIR